MTFVSRKAFLQKKLFGCEILLAKCYKRFFHFSSEKKRFKDLYGFQDDVSQAYINQLLSVWADPPMWNFYETFFPPKKSSLCGRDITLRIDTF